MNGQLHNLRINVHLALEGIFQPCLLQEDYCFSQSTLLEIPQRRIQASEVMVLLTSYSSLSMAIQLMASNVLYRKWGIDLFLSGGTCAPGS